MPIYEWPVLTKLLQEALVSFNDLVAAMNLVLFEDAMMHVCRSVFHSISYLYEKINFSFHQAKYETLLETFHNTIHY